MELASASAFAQMDATLRSGLEAHLAPLGAHIKEALAQVGHTATCSSSGGGGGQNDCVPSSVVPKALAGRSAYQPCAPTCVS